ncbi:hypothetical protein B0J17DRAFT_444518 [Rhizoctonia solani]|nr:hypothetical protein B0J17DRAFT_444518 [Rhizoctonia solani]
MYADKSKERKAAAPPNESERPPSPEEQPTSPDHERTQRHGRLPPTNIMLLGPSGSGKTSLLNLVSDGEPYPVSTGDGLCTTHFRISRSFALGGRPYRLFDFPGFHTTSLNDLDIMRKMAYLLVKPVEHQYGRKPQRLSGILYLHPEGNDAGDERLQETIESLRHFVGDPWLSHITIAVVGNADSDSIAQLKEPTSAFHSLHSQGAKIVPLSLEVPKIEEVLSGFEPTPPSQLRVLQYVRWGHYGQLVGISAFLEEITSSRQKESAGKPERPRRITYEESETSRQQLQVTLDETEHELKSLRSQLEQTQQEYASLRSELQLSDNTEQSKIVQSLQDLNRAIDDFGRSVAQHMVDNFASSLKKEDPTTLDASDFTELQRQFGHQGGKCSLAASLKGEGLPIEDFIDLALRTFLCQKLCKNVFIPFHPTLAASVEPGFMESLYEEVRRQVSPIAAAKWRASSFLALSKGNKLDKPIIEAQ